MLQIFSVTFLLLTIAGLLIRDHLRAKRGRAQAKSADVDASDSN